MNRTEIKQWSRQHQAEFETLSDAIWDCAEVAYQETRSAALQADFLRERGFRITMPVAGIDTAFCAEYGSGSPVIAILGEYDALPGLGQQAGCTQKLPVPGMDAGHGCGHNVLGTAGVEAACAVQAELQRTGMTGTVRYYGCPAEEGGGGKVHMIRGGAFDGVDIAMSWHPNAGGFPVENSPAVLGFIYHFCGKSAHAAQAPYLGRSALDAAELMNIGIQFLREHLPPDTSVQYAFRDAGGPQANIVPDHAAVQYVIRSSNREHLDDAYARVQDIARGAALMTGTSVQRPEIKIAYSDVVRSDVLLGLLGEEIAPVASEAYTPEQLTSAAPFAALSKLPAGAPAIRPASAVPGVMKGSTDVGDVSHIVPTAMFTMTTFAAGTALHSWSATAQGKLPHVKEGMHRAARVMAAAAMRLYEDPALVQRAKDEFSIRVTSPYSSTLPQR